VAGIFRNPVVDFEIRLLEHVGGIDSAGEPAVQPQADHSAEPLAIGVEERGHGRLIAGQGAPEEEARVVSWIGHRSAPYTDIREARTAVHRGGGFFPEARRFLSTAGPSRCRCPRDGWERSAEVAPDPSRGPVAVSRRW